MYKKISVSILVLFMVLLSVTTSVLAASNNIEKYSDTSGNINISEEAVANSNFAFAGNNIIAKSVFDSTTFFAGNSVTLDGTYNGDVFAAGNTITINGKINGNLYVAGNSIVINGEVSEDTFAACSDLTVATAANLNRDLYVTGANVAIDGTVGRNLRCSAGDVSINGTIRGFVESDVNSLVIKDNANIAGEITNRSKTEAIVSNKAIITTINWEKVADDQNKEDISNQGESAGSIIMSIITKLAFILVMWLLITFLARGFNKNTAMIAKKHILASLGLGAAFLVISPLLLVLSFIIYVPFGIATTCLLIATSILAMPVAVVVFSKLLIKYFIPKMNTLLSSFISVLIIAVGVIILGYIPIINVLVGIFVVIMGFGFVWYNIIFFNMIPNEEHSREQNGFEEDRVVEKSTSKEIVKEEEIVAIEKDTKEDQN